MIRGIKGNEIGFLAVVEIEMDIFKESWLIAFNGEVVVGLTLEAYIIGYPALGEQGICGNVFIADID